MAVFKCKMCGGALEVNNNETVIECEYCATKQTLPKLDDDRKANLYDRANHFRRNNEFDKAMAIYEQILNEDNTDAESYWSLVLCRYGIEYVEDPATKKRIPTINRAQFTSVFDDEDYKSALQYADILQKEVYESEAKTINEIQKGILEISNKEDPFDVFICYKETDSNGRRTPDSVLANDLYHQLTQEGFKVFFARITLEDKLGSAYEPYIFAALNSAKVMVVIGSKPEYFNAVWVKNEWSRYLALIKKGAKKMLIPAYKDMDPYDLPEEFSHLQAQDMSKLGFMQDLIRGIKKITEADAPKTTVIKETVVAAGNAATNTAPLLKRAFMFLEDSDWTSADEYCEKVLDMDPECAEAYLGKLLVELRVNTKADLKKQAEPFDDRSYYSKAIRFADAALKSELEGCIGFINSRNLESAYNNAKNAMNNATSEDAYKSAAKRFSAIADYKDSKQLAKECLEKAETSYLESTYASALNLMSQNSEGAFTKAKAEFESIRGYKDADVLAQECKEKAETLRKDSKYKGATTIMKRGTLDGFYEAVKMFESIKGWKDADEKAEICRQKIEELELAEQERKKETEEIAKRNREAKLREENERRIKEKKAKIRNTLIAIVLVAAVVGIIVYAIVFFAVIKPKQKYNAAEGLLKSGDKYHAAVAFAKMGKYKDAKERSFDIWDDIAVRETVATGWYHSVAVKSNGTAEAVGTGTVTVSNLVTGTADWKDIIAVDASKNYTVGLKSNHTVVAIEEFGDDIQRVIDREQLDDVVAISAGEYHIACLRADGTVCVVGSNEIRETAEDWTDIVAISSGGMHLVCLKADGTVVAVGFNLYGQCEVNDWTDIVAIAAGEDHTVGLKSDGTVVATGEDENNRLNVTGWTDIVAISAGKFHTVGLKADGTVVAVGGNTYEQCNVGGWSNIVAISAGYNHTLGLKADGTIAAVGWNNHGQCDVGSWTDIKLPTKPSK